MQEKLEKYALIILKSCLNIEKNQPLFISFNIERLDFVRILTAKAYELGVKEIYYDMVDPYLKHAALEKLSLEELKKSSFWNKDIWNIYARKGAAFLMLVSETPGLMDDIDQNKLSNITMYSYETRREFDNLRDKKITPWCIAAAPTLLWAKQVLPNSIDPLGDLWNKIFEICGINEIDSVKAINDKIKTLSLKCDILNKYNFKALKYTNSLGTNFSISLPNNHIWASGKEILQTGKEILVNYPTEEVFTSPDCLSANGVVYSSKPLSYQGVIIDKFNITFKDGVAVDCSAKKGEETLRELIKSCPNSKRLGEVALVPYDSPISNSKVIFYETLYDENASCHIALGASFPECIKNGTNMTKEELRNNHLNDCDNHVDFMIGTHDLSIVGITHDDKEVTIFKNGNFVI